MPCLSCRLAEHHLASIVLGTAGVLIVLCRGFRKEHRAGCRLSALKLGPVFSRLCELGHVTQVLALCKMKL